MITDDMITNNQKWSQGVENQCFQYDPVPVKVPVNWQL